MKVPLRRLMAGEQVPRWYRVAYWDVPYQETVCCPVGLHLLVRLCRRLWEWSYAYRPSWMESLLSEAWHRGVQQEREYHEHLTSQLERSYQELVDKHIKLQERVDANQAT